MWTPTSRRQHSRDGLRYETDMTDSKWEVIEALLPASARRGRRSGRCARSGTPSSMFCAAASPWTASHGCSPAPTTAASAPP